MVGDLASILESLPTALYDHSITGFGLFPKPPPTPGSLSDVGLGVDTVAERLKLGLG
jgi:hypothetical protein